jgi:hypothetical protein
LYHTDKTKNKKGATPVQIPTEASIVSHAWGVFQVRLANDPTELYDAFWNNLSQSCGTQAVINSPPSTTTDTTLQGFLTIRVDPPGSVIEIAGLGRVAATTGEIPLRVGQYSISVKHDGMPPQERTIAVSAGEHALAEFHLSADPEYPIRHIALTQKLLADGNAVDAIQEANRVLAVVPTNVEARSLLAMASFRANDARGFVSASQQALAGGGGVTITLLHVHTGKRRALHPVNLRISSATMSYDPQGTLCDIPPFEIALNQIGAAEMRKYDNGDVLLVLTGGRLGASKTEQIEFAALGSQWSIPDNQIIPKGVAPLTSPQIAIKMLEAVDLVFRNVLPSMH